MGRSRRVHLFNMNPYKIHEAMSLKAGKLYIGHVSSKDKRIKSAREVPRREHSILSSSHYPLPSSQMILIRIRDRHDKYRTKVIRTLHPSKWKPDILFYWCTKVGLNYKEIEESNSGMLIDDGPFWYWNDDVKTIDIFTGQWHTHEIFRNTYDGWVEYATKLACMVRSGELSKNELSRRIARTLIFATLRDG